LLENLTPIQQLKVKGYIADSNNRLNRIFPSFNPLSNKIFSGSRLINIFSSHFSFYPFNLKSKDKRLVHICKLKECVLQASTNSKMVVVVSDTSIKNHVATSIAHTHLLTNLIIKILHHVVNITITEAKLFAIKCGINQAVQMAGINYIIVVTDSLYTAHRIFDSLVHLYQIQLFAISRELREFFKKDCFNSIKFWYCSSSNH